MTTLVKICPAIVGSREEVVSFLQAKGLLHQQKRCSNRASAMNLQKRRDIEDQYAIHFAGGLVNLEIININS